MTRDVAKLAVRLHLTCQLLIEKHGQCLVRRRAKTLEQRDMPARRLRKRHLAELADAFQDVLDAHVERREKAPGGHFLA
jgi:hypothetical protein